MNFLLHPGFHEHSPVRLSRDALPNLGLDDVLKSLPEADACLSADPEDLRRRQAVLRELLEHPALAELLERWASALDALSYLRTASDEGVSHTLSSLTGLRELCLLCGELEQAARDADSEPFRCLSETLTGYLRPLLPERLATDFDALTTGLNSPASVTLRLRLDNDLHISAAALSRVDDTEYAMGSKYAIFQSLMNNGRHDGYSMKKGFGKNASMEDEKPGAVALISLTGQDTRTLGFKDDPRNIRNLPNILRTGVAELLGCPVSAARQRLTQLARSMSGTLAPFLRELRFLLGALPIARELLRRGGSFPVFAEREDHVLTAREAFHPALEQPVRNPVSGEYGRLQLIGGGTRSGKTTYLRTVGAIQLLGQLGLPVPASEALLSPVERLEVVFAAEEHTTLEHGKLGEELLALREALEGLGTEGLLLCNEPVAGTSPEGCLALSREFLAVCKLRNLRGYWVTQLRDFFDESDRMNDLLPGSTVGRLLFGGDGSSRILQVI